MEDKEKKPQPGDVGYLGGESWATLVVDGKAKEARIRRDQNGNIVYVGLSDKIFGIF